MRACEHCANPDKSRWQTECKYKGDWPSHRAFVRSTFDPPCACDAYEEGQRELAGAKNIAALWITLAVIAALALIFVGLKHL